LENPGKNPYNIRVKRAGRRSSVLPAAAALFLVFAGAPAAGRRQNHWDIRITVTCEGRYGMEDRDARYDGRYAFTTQWVGLMERDDEDFLLIHKSVALERFEAEEKATRADRIDFLTTADFGEKPELRVNYILKKPDGLHVALVVRGFDVPRSPAGDSFPLALPASAEDGTAPAGIKYGAFVSEGSNRVVLDESAVNAGTDVKTFGWKWKYRTWLQKSEQTVLTTNAHTATVTVAVTPHQEAPGPRPADGIYRRPGAAARG
jgi:hypothetical protein